MITGVRLTYHLTRPVMHYRNLFFIVFRVNDAVYPRKQYSTEILDLQFHIWRQSNFEEAFIYGVDLSNAVKAIGVKID